MNGSVRTALKTGIAAVAVSAVAIAPVVLPLPDAPTVTVPSPTSTKYSDTELTSIVSDIAGLLYPPVDLVTGAINGAIGLYDPVLDVANAVVVWTATGVQFIPVVGPPIAGQININYGLIAGLTNSAAPFAISIVSVPRNFLGQVANGAPVGSALYTQAIGIVDASIALGTGVGVSLYNWGAQELNFLTGISLPPISLIAPTGLDQNRVLAESVEKFQAPAGSENGKQPGSPNPGGPAPQNGAPGPGSPSAGPLPGGNVDGGGGPPKIDGPGDDEKDKKDPPDNNNQTTTTSGGVSAQGDVRGGGQLSDADDRKVNDGDNQGAGDNKPVDAPVSPPAGDPPETNGLTNATPGTDGPEGNGNQE